MTLLNHRIKTLMLNLDAAYPSQARDAKQMIKDWRHECRPRFSVVPSSRSAADISSDSLPDDPDDGLPLEGER
jgi:hypothetical protein